LSFVVFPQSLLTSFLFVLILTIIYMQLTSLKSDILAFKKICNDDDFDNLMKGNEDNVDNSCRVYRLRKRLKPSVVATSMG